jgi:hypothetical protein
MTENSIPPPIKIPPMDNCCEDCEGSKETSYYVKKGNKCLKCYLKDTIAWESAKSFFIGYCTGIFVLFIVEKILN